MSYVPVYFSHSYRPDDRAVNDHFWHAFHDAGFTFTVDPVSPSLYTTALELMMARSVGFVAVVTFRPAEVGYQCSPFILYEYGLAVQTHQPRLVLRDKRVSPSHFRAGDTIEFDVAALERCAPELKRRLHDFYDLTASRSTGHQDRLGWAGVALAAGSDDKTTGLRPGAPL